MGAGSLLLALALPLLAAKPLPEPPRGYVHNEGVVSAASEERLSARLSAFERQTGHQFVVALFGSLEGESLEDYANRLFKHWRIGDAKRDDGLLLALFKDDRRWRVEVGYGLEAELTDLEASLFLNDYAVPLFRKGDFDGGVEAAAGALIDRLTGRSPRAPAAPDADEYHYGPEEWTIIVGIIVLILVISFFQWLMSGSGRGRRSGWSSGGWSSGGGGSWGGGGSSGGGGFSGGGGSSGGGGASGGW